ncbi:Hint domain-containing protein [Phaeobacter sp. C3_T13_0]|uniref:Hint domain-containing protein n=1 Tax=Phaeobacter cretensis TaxID=3342641 RepID=UPI0039BC2CE5
MAIGYQVTLGNGVLESGDYISASQSTFTSSTTIGSGNWSWSGVYEGDGLTYSNINDTGTYHYGTDGSVYFVPDNWFTTSGTAGVVNAPADMVEGTSGGDLIDILYSGDPDGDKVDNNDNTAGNNDDLIMAGDGNDTVQGSIGNDTIFGGDGNDYLTGYSGDDLIYGGDGNDNYDSDTGDDTFYGEGGDDWVAIYSNFDGESVYGGDTDETQGDMLEVYGDWVTGASITLTGDDAGTVTIGSETAYFGGFERYYSHSGDDTINASVSTADLSISMGSGSDSVLGGSGDDVIGGAAGDDFLSGGSGADTITGGTGADTIEGGSGDDNIDLGNDISRDTLVTEDFSGSDVVTNFDMSDFGDGTTLDQIDVSNLVDGAGNPVNAWDVTVTDTNGNGTGDAILTFPNGENLTLVGVLPSQVDSVPELYSMGIPCFASGMHIATPAGSAAVENLVPGDLVTTLEHGTQRVLWTARTEYGDGTGILPKRLQPIRISTGKLGNNKPLIVSQQHCILMQQAQTGEHFYIKAKHLAEETQLASFAKGRKQITYHHILLEKHGTLIANEIPSESFFPGPNALKMLNTLDLLKLLLLVPKLATTCAKEAYGDRAARVLFRSELRKFVLERSLTTAAVLYLDANSGSLAGLAQPNQPDFL